MPAPTGLGAVGSSQVRDAQLRMHSFALAYARTLDCWGKSGKFDVIIPCSHLAGNAMAEGQLYQDDTFFEKNDDYFGGKKLEQDPICSAQLHFTNNLGKGVWAALSGTYDFGGCTNTDGSPIEDSVENSRPGFTLALPVNGNSSIKFNTSTSIHTSIEND